MEPYNWMKLIFIFFAFAEAFFMGLLPIKVAKCRQSILLLGIANAFSGGVFIAIALMHIMPEQTESWQETMCDKWLDDNPGHTKLDCDEYYPLPYLLLVSGYVIILVLDKVLFNSHAMLHDHNDDHDILRKSMTKAQITIRDQIDQMANDPQNQDIRKSLRASQVKLENDIKKDILKNYRSSEKKLGAIKRKSSRTSKSVEPQAKSPMVQGSPTSDGSPRGQGADIVEVYMDQKQPFVPKLDEIEDVPEPSCMENLQPFVLMIGLGAHSIFEGISVGLGSSMENVGLMILAIVMHKGAAAMSLGISMLKTFPDRDNFVMLLLFVFSLCTPIGISLGWAIQDDSPLTEIVFNCLAAGTFLYIACSEVIIEEFSMPENKYVKLLFFIVGIALIASLKFLEPADH